MWIAETIDLEDHDSVVKFMKTQSDKIKKLKEENEQLKHDVTMFVKVNNGYRQRIMECKKENGELKQELKIYRKVANCGNCHYHNYDWFDDGDEFEVCDKGNDMSDRICEEWEEL